MCWKIVVWCSLFRVLDSWKALSCGMQSHWHGQPNSCSGELYLPRTSKEAQARTAGVTSVTNAFYVMQWIPGCSWQAGAEEAGHSGGEISGPVAKCCFTG